MLAELFFNYIQFLRFIKYKPCCCYCGVCRVCFDDDKKNTDCIKTESGAVIHSMTIKSSKKMMSKYGNWKKALEAEYGKCVPVAGFQLRYIYFLNKEARKDRKSVV